MTPSWTSNTPAIRKPAVFSPDLRSSIRTVVTTGPSATSDECQRLPRLRCPGAACNLRHHDASHLFNRGPKCGVCISFPTNRDAATRPRGCPLDGSSHAPPGGSTAGEGAVARSSGTWSTPSRHAGPPPHQCRCFARWNASLIVKSRIPNNCQPPRLVRRESVEAHESRLNVPSTARDSVAHMQDIESVCGNVGGLETIAMCRTRPRTSRGHSQHAGEPLRPVFLELLPRLVCHPPFAGRSPLSISSPELLDIGRDGRPMNVQPARYAPSRAQRRTR